MKIVNWEREWFSNIRGDILSGIVVALALIPEAISFSFIAGVDPTVGLYASFSMAVVTAIAGGRPGLISAATGAMSLLMVDLVKQHGFQYLLATTILTGILQIAIGVFKLALQVKYVPRAVMMGFVNALGILIFVAQLRHLTNVPLAVYPMVAVGLAIIYILPRFTKIVPSPLIAIVLITIVAIAAKIDVPTVGDIGQLPTALPSFTLPNVPLNAETLSIIFPPALTMAVVGLLESLLTASVLDELTDTSSDKNREAKGQGIANIITAFLGGMAGCAMIGQSVINIRSGGRGRLSTFCAGIFLLFFILIASDWVKQIPMASLVAVMIMVCFSTVNWFSIKNITRIPRNETAVMITVVFITLLTHNLAIGVVIGVIMSAIFFMSKISQLVFVDSILSADGIHRTYNVVGQIFFASVDRIVSEFDFQEEIEKVTINLTNAHLWDQAAVAAIDTIVSKFRRAGIKVDLIGLNQASASLLKNLGVNK